MAGQERLRGLPEVIFGDLRGVAEIHLHLQGSRDDVVRPGSGVDVGDLQAGGLEVPVAPVPFGFHQFTERGQRRVDRVVRELRVGDMPLFPLDPDGGAEGAAPAHLDHVPEIPGAGGLPDDAEVDSLPPLGQHVQHRQGAVPRDPLLVAGDQECNRAPVFRMRGNELLTGADERRDAALHVRGSPSVQHVPVDHPLEGRVPPLRFRSRRDHIGMARKHEQRPDVPAPDPAVGDAAAADGFAVEPGARQAFRDQCLATAVFRCDRGTADQFPRKGRGF